MRLRATWEPQYEITRIKGDGEAHPALSPDDEFANYENWDVGNLDLTELKKPEMLKGEYAREALKQGLALEAKFGINPYKFGFGGATDSHTSLVTAEEDNFFGKSTSAEPSATRIEHPFIESELGKIEGYKLVASGYTGVWASTKLFSALPVNDNRTAAPATWNATAMLASPAAYVIGTLASFWLIERTVGFWG